MGGLTSLVGELLPIASTAAGIYRTIDSASQQQEAQQKKLELLRTAQAQQTAQLKASQDLETSVANASINDSLAKLDSSSDAAEQTRLAALRKAVAKNRASLAAQGIDPGDGSGEAILLGQIKSNDAEQQAADADTQLQRDALLRQVQERQQRNLLEQSNLAQRQYLQLLAYAD